MVDWNKVDELQVEWNGVSEDIQTQLELFRLYQSRPADHHRATMTASVAHLELLLKAVVDEIWGEQPAPGRQPARATSATAPVQERRADVDRSDATRSDATRSAVTGPDAPAPAKAPTAESRPLSERVRAVFRGRPAKKPAPPNSVAAATAPGPAAPQSAQTTAAAKASKTTLRERLREFDEAP